MEQTPYWADIAFPVLSFLLTIVGPAGVATWVLVRALKALRAPPAQTGPRGPSSPAAPGK